jgi:HSP20 family protein
MADKEIARKEAPAPAVQDVFDVMRGEMNRLFDRFDRGWGGFPQLFGASERVGVGLDVRDDGQAIVIEADLPGVQDKDVTVTLSNGVLNIRGEKRSDREEKKDNYYLSERSFGSFSRSLRLPEGIEEDKVEAKFENGVLRITAPKKAEAAKAERRIEIKGG